MAQGTPRTHSSTVRSLVRRFNAHNSINTPCSYQKLKTLNVSNLKRKLANKVRAVPVYVDKGVRQQTPTMTS